MIDMAYLLQFDERAVTVFRMQEDDRKTVCARLWLAAKCADVVSFQVLDRLLYVVNLHREIYWFKHVINVLCGRSFSLVSELTLYSASTPVGPRSPAECCQSTVERPDG